MDGFTTRILDSSISFARLYILHTIDGEFNAEGLHVVKGAASAAEDVAECVHGDETAAGGVAGGKAVAEDLEGGVHYFKKNLVFGYTYLFVENYHEISLAHHRFHIRMGKIKNSPERTKKTTYTFSRAIR